MNRPIAVNRCHSQRVVNMNLLHYQSASVRLPDVQSNVQRASRYRRFYFRSTRGRSRVDRCHLKFNTKCDRDLIGSKRNREMDNFAFAFAFAVSHLCRLYICICVLASRIIIMSTATSFMNDAQFYKKNSLEGARHIFFHRNLFCFNLKY